MALNFRTLIFSSTIHFWQGKTAHRTSGNLVDREPLGISLRDRHIGGQSVNNYFDLNFIIINTL